jgi:hypothetical protein
MSSQVFVNYALIEKIRRIRGRQFDPTPVSRERDLSETFRLAMNMNEDELIACTVAALQKCPERVYHVLAEDRAELIKKLEGEKK